MVCLNLVKKIFLIYVKCYSVLLKSFLFLKCLFLSICSFYFFVSRIVFLSIFELVISGIQKAYLCIFILIQLPSALRFILLSSVDFPAFSTFLYIVPAC